MIEITIKNTKDEAIEEGLILIHSLFSSILSEAENHEVEEVFSDNAASLSTLGIALVDAVRKVSNES
jgi:hypothetical protein